MKEEGDEGKPFPTLTLRCEYLSFECFTPGYLTPQRHFASISMLITEDSCNMVSENLVGVSVWGCECQWVGYEQWAD